MTITFEYDNDIIIYALEKVISYARRSQQIFVAQCVRWLASIIGLEQGLIICINNLQIRSELPGSVPITNKGLSLASEASPQAREKVNPINTNQHDRDVSTTPRDIQEDPRSSSNSNQIHPDRVSQVNLTIYDNSDLELDDSEPDKLPRIIEDTEQFIQESRKERTALKQ